MSEALRNHNHSGEPGTADDRRVSEDAASREKHDSTEKHRPLTDADQALENQKQALESGEENPG